MPTKSKLEQAVEEQAAKLDPASKELVLSQFATYRWNKARMSRIEGLVRMADAGEPVEGDLRALMAERSQLAAVNEGIAKGLLAQLGE